MARNIVRDIEPDFLVRSPHVAESMNLLALSEYSSMPRKLQRLKNRLDDIRDIYFRLAQLEAATGVARLMQRAGKCCRPEQVANPRALDVRGFTNPVIPNMSPIPSMNLNRKGAFITGQNGIGKSTLLRSLGVNLIAARAFGHCFADQAMVPPGRVSTSIAIEDSPLHGRSLYVAELQRAQELLTAARESGDGVILIDEIFAGTNHLDAVSVAAMLLGELSQYAGVIASSHHVVLAPLLREVMTPMRVVRAASGGILIELGVLVETNGIELIRHFGFTGDEVGRAKAVFRWLSEFMTEPPPEHTLRTITNRPVTN